jgi:hypothetical protein
MQEDVNSTLIEIRERLVKIETILSSQNYHEVESTALEAKQMAMKNQKDIEDLRAGVKWFTLAIIGAVVASVMSLILKP